jgi:hypothetical protein
MEGSGRIDGTESPEDVNWCLKQLRWGLPRVIDCIRSSEGNGRECRCQVFMGFDLVDQNAQQLFHVYFELLVINRWEC